MLGEPGLGIEDLFQLSWLEVEAFGLEVFFDFFFLFRKKSICVDFFSMGLVDPLHFLGESFIKTEGGDFFLSPLGRLTEWAVDGDLPVTEVAIVKDLGLETIDGFFSSVGEV